jgi:hypothetical protein
MYLTHPRDAVRPNWVFARDALGPFVQWLYLRLLALAPRIIDDVEEREIEKSGLSSLS